MKLLLSASGVENRTIAAALVELVGKAAGETKVGFVPTAINAEDGNKDWYINQFVKLWRFGYNWIDVVDPSAADLDWKARLDLVDLVFISGGNTFHLLNQARLTGFDKWIIENKNKKVFVGSSAGTLLLTPTIEIAAMEPGPDINKCDLKDLTGLGLVDFEVEPHCDEARFKLVEQYAKQREYPVYAIDDQTAIKVDGHEVEVITEGFWKVFGK